MNSQNNDDDSMNFSVIEPNIEPQAAADFSVRSLLGEEEQPQFTKPASAALNLHKSVENVFSKMKNLKVSSGKSMLKGDFKGIDEKGNQFMRALAKMQKELSFESTVYNVYDDNPNLSTQIVPSNKSKTYSCLKLTKEETNKSTNKSTIKDQALVLSQYFGPLIIDFKKDPRGGKKSRQKSSLKNDSKSSNISSQYSQGTRKVQKKLTKSKSKDEIQSLFGRQKSKKGKYHLGVPDFRKSKSRSHNSQLGSSSKSHNNIKLSSQIQNDPSSKVFTQYYGTDINFNNKRSPQVKIMKKLKINKVKSRQKSNSLRKKLSLLSPRSKQSIHTVRKK